MRKKREYFSMVTKNKTMFRLNLSIDGTLSSILTVKLGNQEACEKFNPHQDIIASAKKSPWTIIEHTAARLNNHCDIKLLFAISSHPSSYSVILIMNLYY